MSDNLDLTQLTSSQNNKEVTINDQKAELDAALTETLTKTVTSSNAATVTQAELQRAVLVQVDADGGDPPAGDITVTVDTAFKRGLFAVFNNTAQTVTVTVASQPATAPAIPAGVTRVVLLQGASVVDAPGLSFASGTAGSPGMFFAADPDTGFYLKSTGVIGVASGGAEAFSFGAQGGLAPDGLVATPSFSFANDPDTGFYRFAVNTIGVSVGGAQVARINSQGVLATDGSAAAPVYTFAADPDTGVFRASANILGISVAGISRFQVFNNSIRSMALGSASVPNYTWNNDPTTGLYSPATSMIGLSVAGEGKLNILANRLTAFEPFNLADYTVATIPVGVQSDNIFVTDEVGGPVPAWYDGTNWRRYSDGAIVS